MTFEHLLDGAELLSRSGNPDVSGVEYDSRRVKPGCAFVAMRGESSDGNRFIDQAIEAGAVAVVTDSSSEKPRPGVAWAVVPHGRRALARVSENFYRRPAERIAVTGITGTNGKSTTAFVIEAILTAAGRKSALIGTIEYHVAGQVYPAPHTTPEALELARIFNQALGQGASDAVMEVSSHALAQQRVYGIPFDVAVFTNLTRDHLDYHKTMEEYFAAKRVLFEGCGTDPPRAAVTNLDDEYGVKLGEFSRKHGSVVVTYGWERGDLHAERAVGSDRVLRLHRIENVDEHGVRRRGRHHRVRVRRRAAFEVVRIENHKRISAIRRVAALTLISEYPRIVFLRDVRRVRLHFFPDIGFLPTQYVEKLLRTGKVANQVVRLRYIQ